VTGNLGDVSFHAMIAVVLTHLKTNRRVHDTNVYEIFSWTLNRHVH